MKKNASGAKLALRYGYVPCRLGLCGPEDKGEQKIIMNYLYGKDKLEFAARKILKKFKGAHPYYQLIAKASKISNPLDQKVVEAYWIGNGLLDKIRISELKKMMTEKFLPLGKISLAKIKNLPPQSIAYHNFHVLFIGSVTGRFEANEAGQDICRVSWGKVISIKKDKIVVERQPLKFGKKISLDKPAVRAVFWDRKILPEVEENDVVSIHWNHAIEKLSPRQITNIKKYTGDVLKIINQRR